MAEKICGIVYVINGSFENKMYCIALFLDIEKTVQSVAYKFIIYNKTKSASSILSIIKIIFIGQIFSS